MSKLSTAQIVNIRLEAADIISLDLKLLDHALNAASIEAGAHIDPYWAMGYAQLPLIASTRATPRSTASPSSSTPKAVAGRAMYTSNCAWGSNWISASHGNVFRTS